MTNNLEFKQLFPKVKFKKRKFKFSQNQIDFLKLTLKEETKLMFLAGPAGTAKTYMAVYCALQAMIDSDFEKNILYIRSIAESSQRSLGSLPGSIDEKFGVFASPFYDKLEEMLEISDIKLLREKKQFECMPVNFVRGSSWDNSIVIVDEAQNFARNELVTVLTRIGENCKMIICGDIMQSDIKNSGFSNIYNIFEDEKSEEKGIYCIKFGTEDIKRSEILKYIVYKIERNI